VILIVTPLAEEWHAMRPRLDQIKDVEWEVVPTVAGRIGSAEVVLAQGGKGQEHTSAIVTKLANQYLPRYVILLGVSGGFPKAAYGDVIIPTFVHSLDFGKVEGNSFIRRPELDWSPDHRLVEYAKNVAADERQIWIDNIKQDRPDGRPRKDTSVKVGYVASSNKVIDDPSHPSIAEALAATPEILAVEMEAIGAWAAVKVLQSERTIGLLMVRGISDMPGESGAAIGAGSESRLQWKAYAADSAAAFAETLIRRLFPHSAKPTDDGAARTTGPADTDESLTRTLQQSMVAVADMLRASGLSIAPVLDTANAAVRSEIAPLVARLAPRARRIADLTTLVASRTWTAIVGPRGSGKTQIAALVAREIPESHWFSSNDLSSIDSFTHQLRLIAKETTSGRSLYKLAIARCADGALFVFDDLPTRNASRDITTALRDFALLARGRGHILSLTATGVPAIIRQALRHDEFSTDTVPEFDDTEARELFAAHGAPTNMPDNFIAFLNERARGNATLLTAVAEYLGVRNWAVDGTAIAKILDGAHLSELSPEVLSMLLDDVQDSDTRELFHRLRLSRRPIPEDVIRHLAEIPPEVTRPSERLFLLEGLWVRWADSKHVSVAPLAEALPKPDLSSETARQCHLLLGGLAVQKRPIDRDDVLEAWSHYMAAPDLNRAAAVIAAALVSLNAQKRWHETTIPNIWGNGPLPGEIHLYLRLFIRSQQIKIARERRSPTDILLADSRRLLSETTTGDAWIVALFMFQMAIAEKPFDEHLLAHEEWETAIAAADALARVMPPEGELESTFHEPLLHAERIHVPKEAWTLGFYLVGRAANTVERVDRWTAAVDALPDLRRKELLDDLDHQSLVNSGWLRARRLSDDEESLRTIVAVLERFASWAEPKNATLWSYAIRALIIVHNELLHDIRTAIALGETTIQKATTPHARFLIREEIGSQLRLNGDVGGAEPWFLDALPDRGAATVPEQIIALQRTASVLARRQPSAAVPLLTEADDIVNGHAKDAYAWHPATIAGDLGLAHWYNGNREAAFSAWENAVVRLSGDRIDDGLRHGLVALLRSAMYYPAVSAKLGRDLRPEQLDDDFELPVIGFFSGDVRRAERGYLPGMEVTVALQLAEIALALNKADQAAQWLDTAIVSAETTDDPAIRAQVASDAIAFALSKDDLVTVAAHLPRLSNAPPEMRTIGDSTLLAQFGFLLAFYLARVMVTDPSRSSATALTFAEMFKGLSDEVDAPLFSSVFEIASKPEATQRLAEVASDASLPTVVARTAHLLLSGMPGRRTDQKAADHVALGFEAHARSNLWRPAYVEVVLPFFVEFWTLETRANSFRFTRPDDVRRQIALVTNLPADERLQRLLLIVADATGLRVPEPYGSWLRPRVPGIPEA
jgi:nucleoside phosphorylase